MLLLLLTITRACEQASKSTSTEVIHRFIWTVSPLLLISLSSWTHTQQTGLISHFPSVWQKECSVSCVLWSALWLLPRNPIYRSQQLDKEMAFYGCKYNSYCKNTVYVYITILSNLHNLHLHTVIIFNIPLEMWRKAKITDKQHLITP